MVTPSRPPLRRRCPTTGKKILFYVNKLITCYSNRLSLRSPLNGSLQIKQEGLDREAEMREAAAEAEADYEHDAELAENLAAMEQQQNLMHRHQQQQHTHPEDNTP